MFSWIKRTMHRRPQSKRPVRAKKSIRPIVELLEDRITPANFLAPPILVDPITPVRVDQAAYTIRGTLQEAAKNGTTILAYRDSNQNGTYDAGVDALASSATVVKGGTAFAVPVNLQQDAANQFFLIAADGKLRSSPVKASLITEDSTAPMVTRITRLGTPLTNAASVQFQVQFSEPVIGVDASDFQVVRSGSISSGPYRFPGLARPTRLRWLTSAVRGRSACP